MENIPVKIWYHACNSSGFIDVTRQVDKDLEKFKKVAKRSMLNYSEIYVANTPVKLHHDADSFCGVIASTRYCHLSPFDLELVLNFKKVAQRSMSNSSTILMWSTHCKVAI